MRKKEPILQRLADRMDLAGEPLPRQTVVEIAGDQRVLIENYCAVREYNQELICVRVKYGTVAIKGCRLELRRMTKEQLIISGRIDTVTLHRRAQHD